VNYDNLLVVTITVTCYSWAPTSGLPFIVYRPPHTLSYSKFESSEVGFLTTLGVGVSCFFVQFQMSNWIIFYSTLLNWEFLLKWYNFFWNFCWNTFLAVRHDFHWF